MNSGRSYARHVRAARSWVLGFSFLAVVATLADPAFADRELIPDTSLPIPVLHFDSSGNLAIQASATSSERDFDFLVGKWKLRNRKLKSRLPHSDEWITFESAVEMHQILNGLGNIDKYTEMVSGKPTKV
jgi:hypothetical protein